MDRVKSSHWPPVTERRIQSELVCSEEDYSSPRRSSQSVLLMPSSQVQFLWSLVQVRGRNSSHLLSRRDDDAMEDWQDGHSSVDLLQVVSGLPNLCGLLLAFAESKKIHGFHVAQDS